MCGEVGEGGERSCLRGWEPEEDTELPARRPVAPSPHSTCEHLWRFPIPDAADDIPLPFSQDIAVLTLVLCSLIYIGVTRYTSGPLLLRVVLFQVPLQ